MKPYLIRTPEFQLTSGGIRVMYGLYGWLLAKGQEVHLNVESVDHKAIGIYPEIYHDNEMKCDTVVRYILQTPGIMQTRGIPGPLAYEIKRTSNYVYVFSKLYDTIGVDDDHVMFLPILNLHVFKDQHKKRTKTCYLVRGGEVKPPEPDSVLITRDFAVDQQALADLLNECHTLYLYDRMSAMMEIARLCGCKVQYYGHFSKEDLNKYEPGLNGVGYYGEEVELDTKAFRLHYMHLINKFEVTLDNFIYETQS